MNRDTHAKLPPVSVTPTDHPLSISQTVDLFPTDWSNLINGYLKMCWPKLRRHLRETYDNPANWLVIPEFGVRPTKVSFRGFDLLIPWSKCWIHDQLSQIVKTSRELAQHQFSSLAKLRDVANAKQDSRKKETALLYEGVIEELCKVLDWRLDEEDRLYALAEAGSIVAAWAANGPTAGYVRLLEAARRGGQKSAEMRRITHMVDPGSVIRAARAAGWPERRWGVNKEVARELGRSPERIGQILRAERRKLQNERP